MQCSAESFISASLDGAIVIWNSDSLNPTCKLEYPDKFKTEHNQFILPVHHLERLGYVSLIKEKKYVEFL
jgi:hypothetical protein